jgi:DNA-binding beta-propeller fold protein YncE
MSEREERASFSHPPCVLLVIFLLLISLVPSTACAEQYRFLRSIGVRGKGTGQLDYPAGIAIDRVTDIHVTDWRNNRVMKFSSNGRFLAQYEITSKLFTRLKGPVGIAIDSNQEPFVVDQYNNKIKRFDLKGVFISQFGKKGDKPGELNEPRGIAIDNDDNIYVSDYENSRVQKFKNTGDFLYEIRYKDIESKAYGKPRGIACDRLGSLYVIYSELARVVVFDNKGNFILEFGPRGDDAKDFSEPRYIAIDALGYIYITDYVKNCTFKFTSTFEFVARIGEGSGAPVQPEGVALDSFGNVYVCSSRSDCVKVYEASEQIKHLNLANNFYLQGKYEDAIGEYKQVLTFAGDDAEAKNALVNAYYRLGQDMLKKGMGDSARSAFEEMLKYDPLNQYAIREIQVLSGARGESVNRRKQTMILVVVVLLAVLVSVLMTLRRA